MKQTINRLAAAINTLVGEIVAEAGAADADSVFMAETVIHLRDAQRLLNQARDALRLACKPSI